MEQVNLIIIFLEPKNNKNNGENILLEQSDENKKKINKKFQINLKKHFNLNNERNDLNKVIFQNSNKINNQIYKNKDLNLLLIQIKNMLI